MKVKNILLLLVCLCSTQTVAAQTEQLWRSSIFYKMYSALQEGFTNLEKRISDLERRADYSTVYVYSDGSRIGSYLYRYSLGVDVVLSGEEYVFALSKSSGELAVSREFGFDGYDCTGQAYAPRINLTSPVNGEYLEHQGQVFRSSWGKHYYAPKGTVSKWYTRLSKINYFGNGCQNENEPVLTGGWVPVYENDPSITGVPNTKFTPPLTLGY